MEEPARKGAAYRAGELEVILSMVPTEANIAYLANLLERGPEGIRWVYRIAYRRMVPSADKRKTQRLKILAAMKRLGIKAL